MELKDGVVVLFYRWAHNNANICQPRDKIIERGTNNNKNPGGLLLLAHLAEGHESLFHGAASVRPSGVNFFI